MSRPSVLLFDVNETLSDLSPMGERSAEVGLPPNLAPTWFAGLLRDGFAVTVTGRPASFKDVGADVLRGLVAGVEGVDPDAAIEHVLGAFATLDLHPDVAEGLRELHGRGTRMATLTNGSAAIPESLLARAGVDGVMERFLSSTTRASGSRTRTRTGMPSRRWAPARPTRCSSPRTRGTSTERCEPASPPPLSTARDCRTRRTSSEQTSKSPRSWSWRRP
jgi:2-haloalkanoic acid dehalogenase type II